MKLVITLPTRSRPEQLLSTIGRTTANLVLPNTQFILQVDDDDVPTIEALGKAKLDSRVTVNIAPREDTIAGKINRAMSTPADVYLIGADDDPCITPGFDAALLEAADRFEDGIGMVNGAMANLSFSCMNAPTAKLVEMMGYIQPEFFPYWFIDHWTDDIAQLIGRISYADVRSDQSKVGKTMEMREVSWWATFFDASYLMRRKIAHDIIRSDKFIATTKQKEMLLRHHQPIEVWSRYVNDDVRKRSAQLEGDSGARTDEARYRRVKERAIAMVPHLLDDYGMAPQEAMLFRNILIPPVTTMGLKRAFA